MMILNKHRINMSSCLWFVVVLLSRYGLEFSSILYIVQIHNQPIRSSVYRAGLMAWGMRLTSPSPESLLLSSRAGDSTAHRVWVLGTSRRRVRILCDSDRRCICRICSVCVIFSTSQKITKKKTCKFWPLLWYWSTVIWILENTWGRLLSRVYHQVVLWPSLWCKAIETPPPRAFPVATSKWMSWSCFSFPLLWQLVQQVSQNRGTKKKWNGSEHPSITSGGPFGRNPNRTTRVGRFIL